MVHTVPTATLDEDFMMFAQRAVECAKSDLGHLGQTNFRTQLVVYYIAGKEVLYDTLFADYGGKNQRR